MTYYFLQTSLMLLLSYFLGCWLGCMLRTFVRNRQPAPVRSHLRTEAPQPAASLQNTTGHAAPAATAIPVAPRAVAATQQAFRRADLDGPAVQAAARATTHATPAPAPAPVTRAAVAPVPTPHAAPPSPPPVQPPAAVVPPAAAVGQNTSAPVTGVSVTAAAAAAAAAAIAQGRAREMTAGMSAATTPTPRAAPTPAAAPVAVASALAVRPNPAPTAAVAPAATQRASLPAAGASSGVSGVAVGGQHAPAPVAATASAGADDLKRIRGIGPEIDAALHRVGVRRYSEIAGWSASDVDKVSKTLGLKGRIEHENWIEQAQVLSKGGETAFSRRYDRGEIETVPAPRPQAAVAAPASQHVAATLPTPAPKAVAPAAPATPAPAAAPAAALQASAAARATSAEVSSQAAITAAAVAAAAAAAQRAASAASATVPATAQDRVKELSGVLAGKPAQPAAPVATPAAPVSAAPARPATPSPAAAPSAPATTVSGADDLTRIRGVDRDLARMLNDRGIAKFAQIGTWTGADADRFGSSLSLKLGRIQNESWIEQARLLAGMGPAPAPAAPRGDRALGAGEGTSWHQREPRADWSPAQVAADQAARAAGAPASPPAGAVASAVAAAAGPSVAATAGAVTSIATGGGPRVVRSGVPDDLKRIKGIGVVLEKKLHGLGVVNYGQIAGWSQGEIDKMSEVLDFKGRIERENWIEQARILATGGITDFARRVDRGEVETSKPRPVR